MGAHLRAMKASPDLVLCSAARRTRETLDGVGTAVGGAEIRFDRGLYAATPDRLLAALHGVEDRFRRVLLIGHNPGLERLAGMLVGEAGEADILARMRGKFPTGALAVLVTDIAAWTALGPGACRLAAFVRPDDLKEE